MQDNHAGYFLGTTGHVPSILMATGLLLLSITGIVIHLQMYKMRKKVNQHGWIWK